jgi:hypothetical protein
MRLACVSIAALLLAAPALAAPSTAPKSQTPAQRNLADFDFVTSKIRLNYAGWDTKVTPATRPALVALTARLRARAASASEAEMKALLDEWLAFFNDRHTRLTPVAATAGPAGATAAYPAIAADETALRATLEGLGTSRAPIEGIWTIDGSLYRLAIVRTGAAPDRFHAIVLSTTSPTWKPGQIKAEFTRRADGRFDTIFRPGDHGDRPMSASLVADGEALELPDWDNWEREWPAVADKARLKRMLPPSELTLERLSSDALLLRIPDFNDARAKPLRDLVDAHRKDLETTANLVIDLRGNDGGSDFVYDPLIPYLYTRPIVTIGMEMRASADNIALRHAVAQELKSNSPETAADIERQNAAMRRRLGQYVPQDDKPFSIDRLDRVAPYPKRVAVLIDGAGSTGEQFLLLARQSRKTTLFGQANSAGVLDFANVVSMPTPSGRYRLQWATSRSLRLPGDPVDAGGIAPDIRIPADVTDPVMFAADWLRRQRD